MNQKTEQQKKDELGLKSRKKLGAPSAHTRNVMATRAQIAEMARTKAGVYTDPNEQIRETIMIIENIIRSYPEHWQIQLRKVIGNGKYSKEALDEKQKHI